MRVARILLILTAMTVGISAAAQPSACPALVSQAVIAVGEACGGTGRNEACYGNLSMLATPRDPAATLDFDEAGDKVRVTEVGVLQLSALALDVPEWGIAVMALQANLRDNLPGQNATIILFGDVEIENRAVDAAPLPDVFVTGNNVNVRETPSTAAAVVGRLGSVQQRVVGQLADGSWLRVALDDSTDGWVSASVVTVVGERSALPDMTPDQPAPASSTYGPMQAFRLKTGIGAPSCTEAPADGIVIQTPDGAGEVVFEINKVTVRLASTAVVRTTPGEMRLTLLEGALRANSTPANTVQLVPWQTAVVTLDASGDATDQIRVEDAAPADYAALPLPLLPRPVDVPVIAADRPYASGIWFVVNDIEPDGVSCTAADGSNTPLAFIDGEGEDIITVVDAESITIASVSAAPIPRTGENVFSGTMTDPLDYFGYTSYDTVATVTFNSPTRTSISRAVTYNAPNGQSCTWQIETTGTYRRQNPNE